MTDKADLHFPLFKEPMARFKDHLNLPKNERIIFSGKFGHGKTTFLQHFFDDDAQVANFDLPRYNVISLFPVNYSIASNEDIFRYIKYDIILEMLQSGYNVEKEAQAYTKTLSTFMKKNWLKSLAAIVAMAPVVGKDVVESFNTINKIKEDYFKEHDEQNAYVSFENYLEKFHQSEGSIFEDDFITKLIEKVLENKRIEDNKAEKILIIDDLDRIDPEHIFRILNVFAAHFDKTNKLQLKNKFGFDKVILVCDITNIRNIFSAKYGMQTDFNGYIDKFFSNEIYHFSSRKELESFAKNIFFSTNIIDRRGNSHDSIGQEYVYIYFKKNPHFLLDIFLLLFDNQQIDLRNVVKYKRMQFMFLGNIMLASNISIDEEKFTILPALRYLCSVKGDYKSFKAAISNCNYCGLSAQRIRQNCEELIYIITLLEHKNEQSLGKGVWHYRVVDIPLKICYMNNNSTELQISHVNSLSVTFGLSHLQFLLNETIDFLRAQQYL